MKQFIFSIIFFLFGVLVLKAQPDSAELKNKSLIFELEEAFLIEEQLDDDGEGGQYVSGILHGSKDVFMSAAAFSFGPLRFRIRGYDSKYSDTYVNGVHTNDLESGRTTWFLWSGLNDVTRNKYVMTGIMPADFAVGGIGGHTNINTRPSQQRIGTKLVYSAVNKSYKNRVMLTHSTGLMKNGWAFTVSGSKRWAEEGYVEGTPYDALAWFVGIEKKLNNAHNLTLTAFGAQSYRGKQGASTQEVYDLTDNNYYNPYWGWQSGEKRNSRMRDSHKPVFILNHDWKINEKTSLSTGFSFIKGKNTSTSLNWYDAADPRPDYYRYLPSYLEDSLAQQVRRQEFQNGERQLNWNYMYNINKNISDTVENANNSGNNLTGYKSEYIIENRHNDEMQYSFNTVLNKEISDNYIFLAGFQFRNYVGSHYKTVNDLLGGEFIVDIDKYAERDFPDPQSAQSDIRFPNRIVKVDDKFGYDYDANVQFSNFWIQNKFNFSKFDFYLTGEFSYTNFWRTGYMQNGKYPENSLGDSEKSQFNNYAVKSGITYKINGRNYLAVNAAYLTKAPNFRNSFVSSRTRNEIIDNPESEKITSIDGGYILRSPYIKATLNLFYTRFEDQVWVRSFYHDGYRNFVNYAMTGIDKVHKGIEFGIDAKVLSSLSLIASGSFGFYHWDSRPVFNVTVDNDSESLAENEIVYAKGFLLSGTPQTAVSGGFRWAAPKRFWLSANINYIDDTYLSFNPTRRTSEAVEYLEQDGALFQQIVNQEQLPSGYTIDASLGKSIKIKDGYYLSINLNVNNILNNRKIITGGYEQLRFDLENQNVDKFDPKYYYYYGTTYYLNISLRF